MNEPMTFGELLVLFGRSLADARWMGAAESAEYLGLVTYLTTRGLGDQRR